MSGPLRALSDAGLQALLDEDAPHGDLTTTGLDLQGEAGSAEFLARGPMVVAGIEEAARLFELCGCRAEACCASGARVAAGALLLRAEGAAPGLLLAWKVAQTLVEAASGIASATAAMVDVLRAEGLPQPVACTRKNFPGTRALAAKAVRAGGGTLHRLGLSETLLVFPEHRAFLRSDEVLPQLAALRRRQPEKKLVVEVGDEDEALRMARAGVDVLQLERFSPEAIRRLASRLAAEGLRPLLAPAGGVTLANVLDHARAGADLLVTSAPYFAPPKDVQVRIGPRPVPASAAEGEQDGQVR